MRLSALLFLIPALLLSGPGRVHADASLLSVDQGQSSLTYHMIHKFHKIDGTSKKLEGKARILPDGTVQVGVRAPVETFDSQNSNRDAHMKEVVDAAKFPTIELKATASGLVVPTTFPATVDQKFQAEISFHGVKKTMEVPVKVTFESASKVKATAHFTISLEEFKIERPSLMFVKCDDALGIDATVAFKG